MRFAGANAHEAFPDRCIMAADSRAPEIFFGAHGVTMLRRRNEAMKWPTPLMLTFCFAGLFVSARPSADSASISGEEHPVSHSERLRWFQEARFGMFIHWGLYAVPAGEWKGATNHGEWIQYSAKIPGDEYEKLAARFNPVKFNAAEWVAAAKEAGMKYMVITSKHHEGFAMYDSKMTNFDIVDATPFKRDPLKELARECERQGVRFCLYYSVKDWHHREYPTLYTFRNKAHPDGFHGFPNAQADYFKYLDYMQGQLRELMTNYGPVGTLFFDWYGDAFENVQERKRAQEIVDMIRQLQPAILINNRLAGIGADYGTPEQEIPGGTQSTAFEVCMTLNNTWGYSRYDHAWKSPRTVIRQLCDTVSKGGNYLLNVGPTAEGTFPPEALAILKEVGKWMGRNGESIYGAGAGPSMRWHEDIAMVTTRPGKLYLHIFDWPADRQIFYPDFRHKLMRAYMLADADRVELPVKVYRRSLMVTVPERAPDPIDSVLVLEYQ
jgi:alpha-L-fucosidase